MTTFRDEGFDMVGETPNTGYVAGSIAQGLTLVGSNQATGAVLTANYNVVNVGSVCVLPSGVEAGAVVRCINLGNVVITPYPPVGHKISAGTTNVAGGTIAALSGATAGVGIFLSLGNNDYANS